MLKVDENIWILEGGIVDFYGFPYPTRSVIIKLDNNDLWIWSPIKLNSAIESKINSLGTVKHLISPNKIHHLYIEKWKTTYPKSKIWGPQSTINKRQDLEFNSPLNDDPPPEWKNQIDQYWLNGSFLLDEIVFFFIDNLKRLFLQIYQRISQRIF